MDLKKVWYYIGDNEREGKRYFELFSRLFKP